MVMMKTSVYTNGGKSTMKRAVGIVFFLCLQLRHTIAAAQNGSLGTNETELEVSDLVHVLMKKNDPLVRPHVGGPPVDVLVDFYVTSLSAIDEVTMDYTVDIALRQRWNDARLSYDNPLDFVKLTAESISQVWTPDIYFPHEKRAAFHDITVPNTVLNINQTGDVLYSLRVTLVNSCPMDLSYFPLDRQCCSLKFESYSYQESEMTLSWFGDDPIELNEDLQLPEMNLVDVKTKKCSKIYKTGAFPCLEASFILQRRYGFFILQTFIPSILIVILSWVSFWINADAIPARITLGVTTVLTMTTQLSGSKASIPKVSYPKAIDVWMAMCMIFVFAALLEFAFVNAMTRKKSNQDEPSSKRIKNQEKEEKQSEKTRIVRLPTPNTWLTRRQAAHCLDHVSRVMFPALFIIFNILYWSVYLSNPESAC